jgi:hypothetical protein
VKIPGTEKKPMKLGTVQAIDIQTGEVVEERRNAMTLLPPKGDACPVCATDHPHELPHNQQSIYYQMAFYATHGRWPDWQDAMQHCAPEVRAAWKGQLTKMGAWKERADAGNEEGARP